MAGNAQGAALARERQRIKREKRRELQAHVQQQAEQSPVMVADGIGLPDAPCVPATAQALMGAMVEQAGLSSADYVLRIANGTVKANPIRAQVALRVLEFNGFGSKERLAREGDDDSYSSAGMERDLTAGMRALELHQKRMRASDATVIESTSINVSAERDSESTDRAPEK